LCEFRFLGVVSAAANHVHGETRYLEVFLALGIKLRQLGDGRSLAQKPQRVEPTLIVGACRQRQLRDPADLALTLLNELSKLVGDALVLHVENLAAQGPDVRLSIGLGQLGIYRYFLVRSLADDVGL